MNYYFYKSPVGFLKIHIKNGRLYSLSKTRLSGSLTRRPSNLSACGIHKYLYQSPAVSKQSVTNRELKLVRQLAEQLTKYFAGKKIKKWQAPLFSQGTVFQQKVWNTLYRIPYGQTLSYSALAKEAGYPKAVRAVGSACGKNPWLIVVPCHRVLAKNGLGGFALGLSVKKYLLNQEKNMA